jgi:hypothetical protein
MIEYIEALLITSGVIGFCYWAIDEVTRRAS